MFISTSDIQLIEEATQARLEGGWLRPAEVGCHGFVAKSTVPLLSELGIKGQLKTRPWQQKEQVSG